jgi:phosphoserine phosphatase RsbU/P
MGGLETLGRFSQMCPDVPVIIVSGSGKMNDAIAALKQGAWDYLIKPLPESSALTRAIESNLERSRLIRQNRKIRQELELHHEQIREDEEAGRKIQASLFPPREWTLGEYRFQHRVIPSLVLSGDFVDYFNLNDRFAVFYAADISGHGVSSALVTVLVKSLITKYLEHYEERQDRLVLEPDRLLAQLNKDMLHEKLGKHLTVFYGVLDLNANTLRCASGGQYPPPLLCSSDGIRPLEQKGMAVGLFPFAAFQAETLALPSAFRLLVFSDGALDAQSLPTPEARLAHLRTLSTRDALQCFMEEAGANKHLPDDLTVLSVTRGEMP